jgi:hypothetical protein
MARVIAEYSPEQEVLELGMYELEETSRARSRHHRLDRPGPTTSIDPGPPRARPRKQRTGPWRTKCCRFNQSSEGPGRLFV